MTAGIVHRAGEGEAILGGRIVFKADLEQLCVSEARIADAQTMTGPHVHHRHADSFYVLEGQLAILVHDEERLLGAGGCACIPPGVVHGFRTTCPSRYLNFHTPDGGFVDYLRARDRGEEGDFDSVLAEAGTGLPASEAIVLPAGEGERLEANHRIATIKIGREELSLIEFELEPSFEGPPPHSHDDHLDSFYVLDGETEFLVGDERLLLGAGSFVAAPPGVVHAFSSGGGRSRLLNVHAPSTGFHERLRAM